MTELKYNKYVKREALKENKWGGEGINLSLVPEGIIPPEAKISLGVTAVRKPYIFHNQIHKHSYTEYFFFFGSNPQDLHEFDAEVEFSFGEEAEKHIITSPTIVVVPPEVYHCPLNFARIFKPIYCLECFITPQYSSTNLVSAPPPAATPSHEMKYDKYVIRDAVRDNKFGGEGISLKAVPEDIIPADARMSLGVTAVRKPYMFHEPTHKHTFTEYFMFFGSNALDMHEFDAEVEFSIGEEKEKYTITSPSIITMPPEVYHCPLNFVRIFQPIFSLEAFLTPQYTSDNK
jgi:hypothetical protein